MLLEFPIALAALLAQEPREVVTQESLRAERVDPASMASFPTVPWTLLELWASESSARYGGTDEIVWLDQAGPGALLALRDVRGGGTLRVRLDGASEAVLTASLDALSDLDPIPFAERCLVTCDAPEARASVLLRKYDPGASVRSASGPIRVVSPNPIRDPRARRRVPFELVLSPHEGKDSVRSLEIDLAARTSTAGSAISEIRLALEPEAEPREARIEAVLRSTSLHATFDGQETVAVPLDALVKRSNDGSFAVEAWMPFRDRARLSLRAHGSDRFGVSGAVTVADHDWTENSLYFHARWAASADGGLALAVNGRGRVVGYESSGTVSASLALDRQSERIDAHLQTDSAASLRRWFEPLAAPPFAVRAELNLTTPGPERTCELVARFYAAPGARVEVPSLAESLERRLRSRPAGEFRVEGALECEALEVLASSPGLAFGPQDLTANESGRWSAGKHLFVRALAVGQFVELALPVANAGSYEVELHPTRSWDYGTLQCSLDGARAGEPLPTFNAQEQTRIGAPRPVPLGTFELAPPFARLRVEVVGTDARSRPPHYYFGLDCVVLKGRSR